MLVPQSARGSLAPLEPGRSCPQCSGPPFPWKLRGPPVHLAWDICRLRSERGLSLPATAPGRCIPGQYNRGHTETRSPRTLDFPQVACFQSWAGWAPSKAKETGIALHPGMWLQSMPQPSALWAPQPTATRASLFHCTGIKAGDPGGLRHHDALEKEETVGAAAGAGAGPGAGCSRGVLLVAKTSDSQITALAHLCRLCFRRRLLTADSCMGCLPDPNAWTSPHPASVLLAQGSL